MTDEKSQIIWKVLLGIIGIYLFLMMTVFHVSVWTTIKFILLSIFSIFLPGFWFLSLTRIQLSRVGSFCVSYMLGYAFLIFEYYISFYFGGTRAFWWATAVPAVISIICGFLKYRRGEHIFAYENIDFERIEVAFLGIFVALNIFAYSANYLGPDVVPVFLAHRDMQYWTNNTVALKLNWPASNLFMAGHPLHYHYFSSIPIAFLSEVYGIDVFTMSFPLYALTKAIVMVGAVQFLLDSVHADRRIAFWGYIFVLCTTGVEMVSVVTYVHHTLLSPFGFDIGFAYGLLFLAFLFRQWDEDRFQGRLFMATLLAWGMCVGAKAPVASVLLFFAGLICLYWLLQRKWFLAFSYGLLILGLFLVICKYCVGMFSVASGSSTWSLGVYDASDIQKFLKPASWDVIGQVLASMGKNNIIFACLIRIFSINPLVIFGWMVSVAVTIAGWSRKRITAKDLYLQVALGLTAIFGVILGLVVNAGGHSEMYFSMAAIIPMSTMIFINWKKFRETPKLLNANKDSVIYRITAGALVCFLCFCVVQYSFFAYAKAGAIRNSIHGMRNVYHAMRGDKSGNPQNGIRSTDVEALRWIRDYAAPNAMIMTDKAIITNNTGYYLYGIFCERQQYLEGTNMLGTRMSYLNEEVARRQKIVRDVYSNVEGAIQVAKSEGVDYIVQTKDITPEFTYSKECLELVKSTETMNIYRVKK